MNNRQKYPVHSENRPWPTTGEGKIGGKRRGRGETPLEITWVWKTGMKMNLRLQCSSSSNLKIAQVKRRVNYLVD